MENLLQDARYAFRTLGRQPALVLVVTLTLGLAVGATTTIFSVAHATLLRAVPVPGSDRLALVYMTRTTAAGTTRLRWSYPRFQMLSESARTFEGVAAFTTSDLNLTGSDQPERVVGEVVSASYFAVLRVGALRGRTFEPADDATSESDPVVLVSHGLWQRRFGSDPWIVGKTIGINGTHLTVAGVLPNGFGGLSGRADVWAPSAMASRLTYAGYLTTAQSFINVVARLAPGVDVAQANAEMEVLGRQIDQAFPSSSPLPATFGALAVPLNAARIDPANRRSVIVLFGAVACVLLIACVNVTSLLLGRATGRVRETAIRLALGSGRGRLIRLLLTESVLLAAPGAALGLLLTVWGADFVGTLAPGLLPTPRNDYAQLGEFATPHADLAVLGFGVLISLGAGLAFGVAPALASSRSDLGRDLKEGSAGSARMLGRGVLPALVVAEIALALVLLTGAGLLIESFARLQGVDPGFDPGHVLTFWVNPPEARYRPADGPAVVERLLEQVSFVPGVLVASVSRCAPYMSTCARTALQLADQPPLPPGSAPIVGRHYVAADHFRTLGIPLLGGRAFTPADRAGRPRVAIVNQTGARRFWPGKDPIGKRVRFSSDPPDAITEIIGVVGDVKYWPVDEPVGVDFYTSYLQHTYPSTMVFVRAEGDPKALAPALQRAVRSFDRDLPIYDVKLMEERASDALAKPRFQAMLLALFATGALVLAAVGVYGVVAQSVAHRRQEIAIRMALGAEAGRVVFLVLGQGLALAFVGIGLGIGAALAASRLLAGMLYGVRATDAGMLSKAALTLAAVAFLATLVPARRAARVDPMAALRQE
jgi:putative ABC transport system permease protein